MEKNIANEYPKQMVLESNGTRTEKTVFRVSIPKTDKHVAGYHEWIVKKSWLGESWVVEKWECYPEAFSTKTKRNSYFPTEAKACAYAKRRREKFKQILNTNYGRCG